MHGNLAAFRAVTEAIRREGVDATWCLGDLVGYGPHPNECVELATETCALCLMGNHDLAALGRLSIEEFSPHAAAAARWTQDALAPASAEFLGELKTSEPERPLGLYHASPRDPVWEYVLSADQADACMDVMTQRVGAVGHSHVALCFGRADGRRAEGAPAPGGTRGDLSNGEWLVNPGSVGQPRDGDPRAAWLLYDLESCAATWQRVEYPVDETAEAIRAAGLPAALADRLYLGQ